MHKIIQCRQKAWMKPYIDYNTEKRKHAVGKFAKDFYKLMNNSVFGKTMENVRNHCKHKIVTDGEILRKYTRLPNFYNAVDINDEITIVQMKHEMTELNKPIYAGSAILDLSKTLMYKFHYEFARPKFSKNGKMPELCYMDTDLFIYDT